MLHDMTKKQVALICLNIWHAYVINHFSRVQLYAMLWTIHSPPDFSVQRVLQARLPEWVATLTAQGIFLGLELEPMFLALPALQANSSRFIMGFFWSRL